MEAEVKRRIAQSAADQEKALVSSQDADDDEKALKAFIEFRD